LAQEDLSVMLCVQEQNLVENTNILHQNVLRPNELGDLAAFPINILINFNICFDKH
jgi:hypothetical protein